MSVWVYSCHRLSTSVIQYNLYQQLFVFTTHIFHLDIFKVRRIYKFFGSSFMIATFFSSFWRVPDTERVPGLIWSHINQGISDLSFLVVTGQLTKKLSMHSNLISASYICYTCNIHHEFALKTQKISESVFLLLHIYNNIRKGFITKVVEKLWTD